MAEQNANEKPEVTFDAASLEKMSSAQHADMLNAMWAQLMLRLEQLEKPRIGAEADQIDIDGDEILQFERIGNKFYGWIELGKLQEQLGPIGTTTPGGSQFFIRIDEGDADPTGIIDPNGNPVEWLYQGTQVVKAGPAYGISAWVDVDGGYVGDVRNLAEAGNTGIGVQDNGVDVDGQLFADNPNLKFVPIKGIFPAYRMVNEDGEVEVWVDRVNAVDGVCGSESGSV